MKPAIGQRIVISRPDGDPPTAAGIIIEGPMMRAAGVMVRVWIGGGDGHAEWVSVDIISPAAPGK